MNQSALIGVYQGKRPYVSKKCTMHVLPWLNHDRGERHTWKLTCMQWDRDPQIEGRTWYWCGPYHHVRPYHQMPIQS